MAKITDQIQIQNKIIHHDSPPFIIAEVGINHNGELQRAFSLIEIAKNAGADAVKFQTFKAEEFISNKSQEYNYFSQGKKVSESMFQMFKRYEFSTQEWFEIKSFCDKQNIIFLSTPQNKSDLDLLLKLKIPAIKIGSDDFTNLILIKEYTKTKLPIFISCGMANQSEIQETLQTIGTFNSYPTVLLLCTSQYPTPPQDVNIKRLQTLSQEFPNLILGFSDHSQGSTAACMAVALGAKVFEKHFTQDHQLPGPDHWFSEDPVSFKNWIDSIRNSHLMLGSDLLQPTSEEEKMKTLVRRSIVSLIEISVGEYFTQGNIGLKRPGNGIPPKEFEKVLGKKSKKNLRPNTLLTWEDFE